MPGEHRVTTRLPADLYAQLEALGSHGQPMAAIIREALHAYLTRQPWQPETQTSPSSVAAVLAAIEPRLATLEQRIGALEGERPTGSQRQPRRQPAADATRPSPPTGADSQGQGYDPSRYILGKRCPRGHEWRQTGQTLRRRTSNSCPQCDVQQQRERRAARRREGE